MENKEKIINDLKVKINLGRNTQLKIPIELYDDEDFVLFLMERKPKLFKNVSNRLKDNEKVVDIALEFEVENFKHVSERLRADKDFILELIKLDKIGSVEILKSVKEKLKGDRDFIEKILKIPGTFKHLNEVDKENMEYIDWAIKSKDSLLFKELPIKVIEDTELITKILIKMDENGFFEKPFGNMYSVMSGSTNFYSRIMLNKEYNEVVTKSGLELFKTTDRREMKTVLKLKEKADMLKNCEISNNKPKRLKF